MKFQQELENLKSDKNPPTWASKANYYFENGYGEQWIAYIEEGYLYVSGSDIGWKVMQGNVHHAIGYLEISEGLKTVQRNKSYGTQKAKKLLEKTKYNPFFEYSLNSIGENTWLCSVIEANLSVLEDQYNEMKEENNTIKS